VLGDTLAAAKAAIIAAHCKLGKVTRQPAAAAKLGLVLSQKPRAGTSRPAGTKVKLVLGS
jgi:beta-lactam-binding protein with PASTA domain